MKKYRAIPDGFMTVGEAAKKMNTTVRTLQYYDKEGILVPSAESEGGRRLYTDKDIIKLHQILSMKYLGFSLDDIKGRLICLDTPTDVASVLAEQADNLRDKIAALTESLKSIEMLKTEVLQMQTVDFKKYADIVANLQLKNEYYWMIKHFDNETLDIVANRFDSESAKAMTKTITCLMDRAVQYQKDNISPESDTGQEFAKEFWDTIMEFADGDMNLVSKLEQLSVSAGENNSEFKMKQDIANSFIEPALGAYFTKNGINPFHIPKGEHDD